MSQSMYDLVGALPGMTEGEALDAYRNSLYSTQYYRSAAENARLLREAPALVARVYREGGRLRAPSHAVAEQQRPGTLNGIPSLSHGASREDVLRYYRDCGPTHHNGLDLGALTSGLRGDVAGEC